jgi:sterol desaturase/sphingolipid hydroxylase (fatty acid hydroxylase superfamily)
MTRAFPYEKKHDRLLNRQAFTRRLAFNGALALGVVIIALAIGMTGYMALGGLGFIDAFLNAAMILSGMGPVDPLTGHPAAKVFAGLYAIVCGLLIFAIAGITLAPVFHRILHSFHLQDDEAN